MTTQGESSSRARPVLRISGIVLVLAALALGVVSAVKIVDAVGEPLTELLTADSQPTPYSAVLTLEEGSYTVFERVPSLGDDSGFESDAYGATTLTSESIRVSGSGRELEMRTSPVAESVDRGADHYVGVARFSVPEAGDYLVEVGADDPPTVIVVAPSLGAGFGEAGGWLAGVAGAGLGLLTGLGLLVASFLVGRPRRGPATAPAAGHPGVPPPPQPMGQPPMGQPPMGQPPKGQPPMGQPPMGQSSMGQPPAVQQPAPTPPGWYPDPQAPHLLRYWDGTAWTAHTQPRG